MANQQMMLREELLERIRQILQCDGITRVEKTGGIVSAWIEKLEEGKDWKVPVMVNFVPNAQTGADESVLQIYFTLSRNVDVAHPETLMRKLNELNERALIGSMFVLPIGEICYEYHLPVKGNSIDRSLADFEFVMKQMLAFLFRFYLYILVLSGDSGRMTLEEYLELEE